MASKVPRHIAIILDGNRRYGKKLGLQAWKGHEYGLRKLEELFKWSIELGIKELTLYSFSTENFKRKKQEINFLFELFWNEFEKVKSGKGLFKHKIRVNVIGRTSMFSKKMRKAMLEVQAKSKKNRALIVNFALGYGGRQEIIDAFRKITQLIEERKIGAKNITEALIAKNLYLKSEPDLVIRPGGEIRTSNFLTWQSIYSEWFFIKKLWPEFTKEDLEACIDEFNKRERRFGK